MIKKPPKHLSDGIDHINIYSKSRHPLGVLLSNFCRLKFLSDDGQFTSIEGYWYWLLTDPNHPKRDLLRDAYGWRAKELGRELNAPDWPSPKDAEFKRKIIMAMRHKACHSHIKVPLRESTLPFTHYYVYNGKSVPVKGCKWILDAWEEIRKEVKSYPDRDPI